MKIQGLRILTIPEMRAERGRLVAESIS